MKPAVSKPHLLRHEVTEQVAAAAAAAMGKGSAAAESIWHLRQPELRARFRQVYGVQTTSGNNGWMRGKLLQAIGFDARWRPPGQQAPAAEEPSSAAGVPTEQDGADLAAPVGNDCSDAADSNRPRRHRKLSCRLYRSDAPSAGCTLPPAKRSCASPKHAAASPTNSGERSGSMQHPIPRLAISTAAPKVVVVVVPKAQCVDQAAVAAAAAGAAETCSSGPGFVTWQQSYQGWLPVACAHQLPAQPEGHVYKQHQQHQWPQQYQPQQQEQQPHSPPSQASGSASCMTDWGTLPALRVTGWQPNAANPSGQQSPASAHATGSLPAARMPLASALQQQQQQLAAANHYATSMQLAQCHSQLPHWATGGQAAAAQMQAGQHHPAVQLLEFAGWQPPSAACMPAKPPSQASPVANPTRAYRAPSALPMHVHSRLSSEAWQPHSTAPSPHALSHAHAMPAAYLQPAAAAPLHPASASSCMPHMPTERPAAPASTAPSMAPHVPSLLDSRAHTLLANPAPPAMRSPCAAAAATTPGLPMVGLQQEAEAFAATGLPSFDEFERCWQLQASFGVDGGTPHNEDILALYSSWQDW